MSLSFSFSDMDGWRKACVWSSSILRSFDLIFTISSKKKEDFNPVLSSMIIQLCSHQIDNLIFICFQYSSVTQSCPTLCNPMNLSTPGLPVHHQPWSPPKLISIESVMTSNHLILCHPLLLLPSIFPSIRVFSNESTLHIRWPKYWSFSFSISPSNEHPGLISFRMDWLDLLAVQGTLKSLRQHHSSKASILRCSAFFTAQLSHPYMTTGKTTALTRRTFLACFSSPWICVFSKMNSIRACLKTERETYKHCLFKKVNSVFTKPKSWPISTNGFIFFYHKLWGFKQLCNVSYLR